MITFTAGDILQADTEAVVNAVNTVGVMGKGLALQFKKAFPQMFEAYAQACKRGEVETGKMHLFDRGGPPNPRYIVSFPTKEHWRGGSKLAYVANGLRDLVLQIERLRIRSISIPALGCGLGGLDWTEVKPLVVEAFKDLPDVAAFVYPPAGSASS